MESYDDEATEAAGSNRSKNEAVEQEIKVKWQMPGKIDLPTAKKQILQLLTTLLVAFPNQVTLIDSKKREWAYQENESEEKFEQEFGKAAIQLHPMKSKQKGNVKWIAITVVRTSTTIAEWKDNDQFYANISDMKTYVFPHPFEANEWDISSIGFIKGVHAIHVPKEDLHQQLLQKIKQDNPNANIPKFQLIPQRITSADKQASTKAFAVQCPKSEAQQLIHMLTHGSFRTTSDHMFVPFRYKATKPDVYRQCIRQQNEVYHKTWIIKLEGLTNEAIQVIEPEITSIKGVYQIVSSKRTKETGERKILVEQTRCAYIHRYLNNNWTEIVTKIPTAILAAAPESFSSPMVSSKKVRDYQDTDSDADSYGSLLTTGTDITQPEQEVTELDDLPVEYQYPTYATAVMESSTSTGSTQISSPTVSAHNDWQREKHELEAQIQKQALQIQRQEEQIEKIQGVLEAKITRSHELEEKLAQALDLAHDRDARHEEILEKFEALMRHQEARLQENLHQQMVVSTPEKHQAQLEPPPNKKANTNSSPARHMYAMFRQTSGGKQLLAKPTSMTKQFANRQMSSTTAMQNMETDDDSSLNPPAVRPGKKLE